MQWNMPGRPARPVACGRQPATSTPGASFASCRSITSRFLLRSSSFTIPACGKCLGWHLAYATNFRVALDASTFPEQGGFHFWTLAVEEQFYLIWPALILLVPRRHVLKTIFLALAGGLIFRVVCVLIGQRGAAGVWPFACFDLFAFGAALAAWGDPSALSSKSAPLNYHRAGAAFCRWCACIGIPALLVLLTIDAWHLRSGRPGVNTVNLLLNPLAAGAVFAVLIARTARGFTGAGKAILEFPPLLFLGKISYGLYIYHNFMQRILWQVFERLHLAWPTNVWLQFCIRAAATVLVASASWYLIEKPINGLKKFFEYAKPAASKAATSSELPRPAPLADGAL